MAMRDEIREQRAKLKGKSLKEKFLWFKEYDMIPTIVIVLSVIFVVYLVVTMVTARDSAFGVMFINANLSDNQAELLEEDFMEYAGIDSGKYEVYMDLDESHSISDEETTMDMYSTQVIMTRLAAGQADVMIADAYMFDKYVYYGYFYDLTTVLDEETLEEFSDHIYWADQALIDEETDAADNGETAEEEEEEEEEDTTVSLDDIEEAENSALYYIDDEDIYDSIRIENFVMPDPSTMEDPVAVGIVVNSSPYILENGNYDDIVCLYGILANVEDPTYAVMFFDYLFENEQETR